MLLIAPCVFSNAARHLTLTLLAQRCQGMVQSCHAQDGRSLLHSTACFSPGLRVLGFGAHRKALDPPAQVETAVALWRRMPEAGVVPMHGTLATVLRACRIAYQGERALALLAEARAAGVHAARGSHSMLFRLHCLHAPR